MSVLEHALLHVKPGDEDAFERTMGAALPLMSATDGFEWVEVRRCLENPRMYLLLVQWKRLEDHTEGFRGSARYAEWRKLLHHFYDPFPEVVHFAAPVASA